MPAENTAGIQIPLVVQWIGHKLAKFVMLVRFQPRGQCIKKLPLGSFLIYFLVAFILLTAIVILDLYLAAAFFLMNFVLNALSIA